MKYIGIDPGKTGAAALLDEDGSYVDSLCFEGCSLLDIATWLVEHGTGARWAVEKVHPMPAFRRGKKEDDPESNGKEVGHGSIAAFRLGQSLGQVEAMAVLTMSPLVEVSPQSWKAALGLRGAPKDLSRNLACDLFPRAPLARKKDVGLADALLIAEYARRRGL